jgi:hypothetical protein
MWMGGEGTKRYDNLADGVHVFRVRRASPTPSYSLADTTAAERTWTIDTTLDEPTVSYGLDGETENTIDLSYITALLGDDWGFWYTVVRNPRGNRVGCRERRTRGDGIARGARAGCRDQRRPPDGPEVTPVAHAGEGGHPEALVPAGRRSRRRLLARELHPTRDFTMLITRAAIRIAALCTLALRFSARER